MTLSTVNPSPFYQGDNTTIPFTITDNSGNVVNITNATFTWVVWNISFGNVITKTLGSGLAFGDPTKGQLAATLVYNDTATIVPTQYVHMLEMVLAGNRTVEATGMLSVLKNYTLV